MHSTGALLLLYIYRGKVTFYDNDELFTVFSEFSVCYLWILLEPQLHLLPLDGAARDAPGQ